MIPLEALELALSKEKASVKLYRRLALEHSSIGDLLGSLINEEEKHVKMIEEKIRELTQ
jgi:rubrerythrin